MFFLKTGIQNCVLYSRQVVANVQQCSYFPIYIAKKSLMCICLLPLAPTTAELHQLIADHRMPILPDNKPWVQERNLYQSLCAGILHLIWFNFIWLVVWIFKTGSFLAQLVHVCDIVLYFGRKFLSHFKITFSSHLFMIYRFQIASWLTFLFSRKWLINFLGMRLVLHVLNLLMLTALLSCLPF